MTEIAGVPLPQLPVALPSLGDAPAVSPKEEPTVPFDAVLALMNARAVPARMEVVALVTDRPTQLAEGNPAECVAPRPQPAKGAAIMLEDRGETIAPTVRHESHEEFEAVQAVAIPPAPYPLTAQVSDLSGPEEASRLVHSRDLEVADAQPTRVAIVTRTAPPPAADPRPLEALIHDEPLTEAQSPRRNDQDTLAPPRAENVKRPVEVAYQPAPNPETPIATPALEAAVPPPPSRLQEPAPQFEPRTEMAEVSFATRAQVFNEAGLFRNGQVVLEEAIVVGRSDTLRASFEPFTSDARVIADKASQAVAPMADTAATPVTAPEALVVGFVSQVVSAGSPASARAFIAPDSAMPLPVAASPLRAQSRAVSASSDRPAKAARPFIPDPQETTAAAVQIAVEASDHGVRVAIAAKGLHREERERLRDRVAATMSRRGLPIQSVDLAGLPAPHHPIATGKE